MASFRKRGKVWYFRITDENGGKVERKGCSDRRATEEMARAAESEAAKIRSGLVDPKELVYHKHAARSLAEHLADWHAALAHKGHTAKHADQSTDRVRRLIAVMFGANPDEVDAKRMTRDQCKEARQTICRLVSRVRLSDMSAAKVQSALAQFRDANRSLQTCNHYRSAARAFCRWAWKDGRLRDDPLVGVTGYNAKQDRRHDRRTISLDELRRLIEVAQQGRVVMGMIGPARALCYRLAVASGLRYSEIGSITRESFDWDSASVTVAAAYTKNGDPATLAIPNDLAEDLAAFVATLAREMPVFPLPEKGAKMLRVDLEAAGIPYRDASGLYFDFHALRCQCATLADAVGVSPRVVQRLMRHSSLELTGRYTRPRSVDIEAATSMLPKLTPEGNNHESLAATGTDGRFAHRRASEETKAPLEDTGAGGTEGQRISERFAHYMPTGGDGNRCIVMDSEVLTASEPQKVTEGKSVEFQASDADEGVLKESEGSTPDWIRTSNLRFRRPMLYPVELRVRNKRRSANFTRYRTLTPIAGQVTALAQTVSVRPSSAER
jgi:integrase